MKTTIHWNRFIWTQSNSCTYQARSKQLMHLSSTQKQQAISRSSNLAGFSEKDITELIALVGRWNKQWPGIGSPGLDQGNGSSSMNGSKLDRLIRH